MAICRTCGNKYSKWTTPVSAKGTCRDCFEAELKIETERRIPEVELKTETGVQIPEAVLSSDAAPEAKRKARIRLTSFIPRSRSKAVFVFTMSCYCVTVSYFIITWARVAHVTNPPPWFYSALRNDPLGHVFELVLFAPIIESLLLVGVFELVRRVHAPIAVQIFTAALFISELHVWGWWPHGIIVLLPFCIQAASYSYWRRRSRKEAFWVVVWIHALNNLIPALSAISYATRMHA